MLSESKTVVSGIPQGSCIGPLFFNLFVNDIHTVIPRNVAFAIYADDLKIYAPVPQASAILQETIDLVSNWSGHWNLTISIPKTYVMHYGPLRSRSTYTLFGQPLQKITSVRDLGVNFTPELGWSKRSV